MILLKQSFRWRLFSFIAYLCVYLLKPRDIKANHKYRSSSQLNSVFEGKSTLHRKLNYILSTYLNCDSEITYCKFCSCWFFFFQQKKGHFREIQTGLRFERQKLHWCENGRLLGLNRKFPRYQSKICGGKRYGKARLGFGTTSNKSTKNKSKFILST